MRIKMPPFVNPNARPEYQINPDDIAYREMVDTIFEASTYTEYILVLKTTLCLMFIMHWEFKGEFWEWAKKQSLEDWNLGFVIMLILQIPVLYLPWENLILIYHYLIYHYFMAGCITAIMVIAERTDKLIFDDLYYEEVKKKFIKFIKGK